VDEAALPDPTMVVMTPDLLDYHCRTGLAAIPYSSQAGGFFHRLGQGAHDRSWADLQRLYDKLENAWRCERALKLASDLSLSLTQVVLGYLLSQPFVTVPIVGCRTLGQLADSLQAAEVSLAPGQTDYLLKG
jgi:aryl-alcohol dehydrogenase-like predicted oxidoreductase